MLEQFTDELLRKGASVNTISTYRQSVEQFINWYTQTTGVKFDNKISSFDCRAYKAYLCTVRKQRPASVNTKMTALQQFANFLYAAGLQEEIKVEKQRAVTNYSVKALNKPALYRCRRWIHHNGTKRDIAIFELILNTGIRESELSALELDDMEITERKGSITIRNGKGGKYRQIPLNRDARQALQEYIKVRPMSPLSSVFLGQRGPLQRHAVYKIIRDIGRRGGGTELSPHLLRHTCFTIMAKNGADLPTIADIAGHSDVRVTAKYYIATSQEDRERAVNCLSYD